MAMTSSIAMINVSERDILLDEILNNLFTFQDVKKELKRAILICFSIDLTEDYGTLFNATRKKSVIHFMVRKLLRFNLDCAETCQKYYGNDLSTQFKLELLIKAARSFPVFDEQPPDIPSKNHPSFDESSPEGKKALRVYFALDALRLSFTRKKNMKKIAAVPSSADKVTCSSSSSSNQLSTVLGKRTSESSAPMELLIDAAASVEENKGKMIGLDPSAKENGTRDLRKDLDATQDSVEMARKSTREDLDATEDLVEMARESTNVCELYLFNFFHLF
jgi:hypothetical protein